MPLPHVLVPHPHVEHRPDVLAGSPIVRGTKVPVRRLWKWHRSGVTVETLVKRYPQLGPARVLDALAFAYDNQAVVEADLERERRMLDDEDEIVAAAQRELPKAPTRRGTLALTPLGESVFASPAAERAARIEHGDGVDIALTLRNEDAVTVDLEGEKPVVTREDVEHNPDCAVFDFDPDEQLGSGKRCDCRPASDRSDALELDEYVPTHCKRSDGSSPVGVCVGPDHCSCECTQCIDPR